MNTWQVEWTGSYPCLCSGEWVVYKNGVEIDMHGCPFCEISEIDGYEYRDDSPARTLGTYSSWHFEDWLEVSEYYEDGLDCDSWCKEYADWLRTIAPVSEWRTIFEEFQKEDWRYNSCMGCV